MIFPCDWILIYKQSNNLKSNPNCNICLKTTKKQKMPWKISTSWLHLCCPCRLAMKLVPNCIESLKVLVATFSVFFSHALQPWDCTIRSDQILERVKYAGEILNPPFVTCGLRHSPQVLHWSWAFFLKCSWKPPAPLLLEPWKKDFTLKITISPQ